MSSRPALRRKVIFAALQDLEAALPAILTTGHPHLLRFASAFPKQPLIPD
jgi:hypothetical protein